MLFEAQIHDLKMLLPWNRIKRAKAVVRELVEQKRRLLSPEQVLEDSQSIIDQIKQMECFHKAQTIMLYYPIHNEVNLLPLLQEFQSSKTLLLPVTHRRKMDAHIYDGEDMMRKGHYRVPEPQTPVYTGPIDMIIVPGVAFDHLRHRIGRGGGFYDKFLALHPQSVKVGVGYDFQLRHRELPHSRRDHRMDRVVTPSRTIE